MHRVDPLRAAASPTGSGGRIGACCAGTTSSRSRSSRVAEDERPVLTAELPIERLDRDELGLTIARLLGVCDRLLDESAALDLARRQGPAGRRPGEPPGGAARPVRRAPARAARREPARRRDGRARRSAPGAAGVLAAVAGGPSPCRRSVRRPRPRTPPRPDGRLERPLRRPAEPQADPRDGRPPATNHRTDTVIRSYFFDHVVLGFLPERERLHRRPRRPAPSAHPTVQRHVADVGPGARLGRASGRSSAAARRSPSGSRSTSSTRRRRRRPAGPGRLGDRDVPGLGGGHARHAGQQGPGHGPGRTTGSRCSASRWPVRRQGPTGTTGVHERRRSSAPAVFGAYVLADRPGAYRETPARRHGRRRPVLGRRPLVAGRRGVRRRGSRASCAGRCRRWARSSACAPVAHGAPTARHSPSRRRSRGRRAGTPPCSTAGPRGSRSPTTPPPAVVLHEAAHAWFNGALRGRPLDGRGLRRRTTRAGPRGPLKIKVPALPLTKALLAQRIPLNAWASDGTPDPVGRRVRDGRLARARPSSSPTGSGPTGLTAVWKAIVAGEMADQPAVHAHAAPPRSTRPARASPDWRALLDLIETRTGKDVTDLWRTWVVRPEEAAAPRPARDGPGGVRVARRRGRRLGGAAGDPGRPRPLAVRPGGRPHRPGPGRSSPARPALAWRRPTAIGVQLPGDPAHGVRERPPGPRRPRPSWRPSRPPSTGWRRPSRPGRSTPALVERIGLARHGAGGRRSTRPGRRSRRATSTGAVRRPIGAATIWVGAHRRRPRPARDRGGSPRGLRGPRPARDGRPGPAVAGALVVPGRPGHPVDGAGSGPGSRPGPMPVPRGSGHVRAAASRDGSGPPRASR